MYYNIISLYLCLILINYFNIAIFTLSILTIDKQSIKETLDNAITITKQNIENIYNEWQIDKYPKFLKSCYMHKVSWELLSLKYQKKIMEAILYKDQISTFVISFTGSSVTAGHDSPFNFSTSIVTGQLMESSFKALNIKLDSRSAALGNNPCTPYDMCVKYFAGNDADIVHWEQSYFCGGKGLWLEQFIRQASFIPSQPIIVFSDSNTGHWTEDVCTKPGHVYTHTVDLEETALLQADPISLVSMRNKDEFNRVFGQFDPYTRMYHSSGIQTFHHLLHDQYACMGPYIPTWMRGASSWHPSIIGHRLRAAHHAYFWLLILVDAIEKLQLSIEHRTIEAIHKDIVYHLKKLGHVKLEPPIHESVFPDNVTCYTDYEPRAIKEISLKSKVIHGLVATSSTALLSDSSSSSTQHGWKYVIYEMLANPNLVKQSLQQGYLDYKNLLYGDITSGPLSIELSILPNKLGPVFICEAPGIWGHLPNGFQHLWKENMIEVYLTYHVLDYKQFIFNKDRASRMKLHYNKDLLELCVQIYEDDILKPNINTGNHVLTIIPVNSQLKVLLAWIVTA